MIGIYLPRETDLNLQPDLAGEFPVYIYWPEDKSFLLYSRSIEDLLADERVTMPLKVCYQGLSFLLQSGVVPPPCTAYVGIYILGIGIEAKITTIDGKVEAAFHYNFPFSNANRLAPNEMKPDEELILQLLAEATVKRMTSSAPSFLFHSAGKDSNSIALALAEAGWQDKLSLITHKSKGKTDESEISAKIAEKLGFKHHVLHEVDLLKKEHVQAINDYFESAPFPSTDNVTLAYPLYSQQLPKVKSANIIDGMGNDVYIGHIPNGKEYKLQSISKYIKKSRSLTNYLNSENNLSVLGRSRSEWTGLSGLSYSDVKTVLPYAYDVSNYWFSTDTNEDYLDFRASFRGTIIDQEIFTRKARNFASSINSNLILPWANQHVAEYFSKLPEKYVFDRKCLKNKLVLRTMLKNRLGLDSDAVGKMSWTFDSSEVVRKNLVFFTSEIESCKLWDHSALVKLLNRFTNKINHEGRPGFKVRSCIYRLYLISSWYNRNRYLNATSR
ncbi:asparagine synthase-related protein [Litchfieldella xinjiangensis]|uniref:asparagine synthase-related protein n=1 Tax=Litchfieldella xinjiangensis TaxID=1166948 RepID=UPI0005BC9179|nr:asparagine synthase-related protein [Halomonas xinjiangensis]